jgi:hypothetical protein
MLGNWRHLQADEMTKQDGAVHTLRRHAFEFKISRHAG